MAKYQVKMSDFTFVEVEAETRVDAMLKAQEEFSGKRAVGAIKL